MLGGIKMATTNSLKGEIIGNSQSMKNNNSAEYLTDSNQKIRLTHEMIKKYLVNGNGSVTDQEVQMFLQLCKYQKLNPFLREAYLIKFGTSPATIVIGKEVFTKRAMKDPDFKGMEAGIIVINKENQIEKRTGALVIDEIGERLIGGWAKVYKKDYEIPIESTASMKEYDKGQSSWRSMPATMIRKVALVQALREAFPNILQGMYSQEEMPVDEDILPIDNISTEAEKFEPINEPEETNIKEFKDSDCISEKQAKRIFALSRGNADLCAEVIGTYGYESSKDIRKIDYKQICSRVEELANNQAG